MAKLLVAGDFCPQSRVTELFEADNFSGVLEEVKQFTERADFSIVNMECPVLSKNSVPIIKRGPSLCCSEKAIEAIQYAGFDCVTLANNHFRDYGDNSCVTTLEKLRLRNISFVGGGINKSEAQRTLFVRLNDCNIAILNFCEHEFSIATNNRPGSAPLDLVEIYHHLVEAKRNADFVIIIVHGGNEMFQLPTPRMQKTYRWFIDIGADTVINHHQHCFSGYETYNGKPIFYGLGNFCFDRRKKDPNIWNEGYMVELIFDKPSTIIHKVIPYKQGELKDPALRFLKGNEYEDFIKVFNHLSEMISNPDRIIEEYEKYVQRLSKQYLMEVEPYNAIPLLLSLRKRGLFPSFFSKKALLHLFSILNCESHSDILIKAISSKLDI